MRFSHLLLFGVLLYLPSEAKAQTHACSNIRVAFSENWFPVSFSEKQNKQKMAGIAYDIFLELAAHNNIELIIVNPIPWQEAINQMNDGKIDALSGHYWTESRAKKTVNLRPVAHRRCTDILPSLTKRPNFIIP